jgi:tricorn protease
LSSLMGEPVRKVHRFDLHTRTSRQILDAVTNFDLSFNGAAMLYARQQEPSPREAKQRRWFIARIAKSPNEPGDLADECALELDSMKVHIDPRAEWRHMFEQVWRNQRDFFYDHGLRGLNIEKIKERYAAYLESLSSRDDLDYLFGEMLANLHVGHMAALSRDRLEHEQNRTGLLGADYVVENGRYRFARIYQRDPWNPDSRAPLGEPGMKVQAGEYLLAVDGLDVRPSADVYSYFEESAGRQVVLSVGPEPDGTHARDVTVVPIDDESALRNFAWVEESRRRVDELTRGRVAYVYLPDTYTAGYANFNRYFFAQAGKDAVILDVRYNSGGVTADYVIDCLGRPRYAYYHMREGQDITSPMEGIIGPKVMLINEMAGSGGDILPWMFRKAGLGPLIGKRTWGGVVGHYANPGDLLDGGYVATPNLAFYSPDHAWDIENHGVPADIEVEDDPAAARAGRDLQLEKAVEVILDLLKKNPPVSMPRRPSHPIYQWIRQHE